MTGCRCKICVRSRKFTALVSDHIPDKDKEFMLSILDELVNAEADAEAARFSKNLKNLTVGAHCHNQAV